MGLFSWMCGQRDSYNSRQFGG